MTEIGVKFDERRALGVLGALNGGWNEKTGIFTDIILPQNRWALPAEPLEQALYFFFSALFMRGGIISEDPFRWLHALYSKQPEFFNPYYVKNYLLPVDIEKKFIFLTPGIIAPNGQNNRQGSIALKIKEHSHSWCHNAAVLAERWQGDPRCIYAGVRNFEEAFARVDHRINHGRGIIGMRRKIFSLLTIWLQEKNLIPFFACPIPVDFHALRIFLATDIISLPAAFRYFLPDKHPAQLKDKEPIKVRESLINEITFWSESFIAANRLSHLSVNPALWVLSRDLCANHFQNISHGAGWSYVNADSLKKDARLWPARYRDPCQFCPIENYCRFAVPAAPYYRWGILARMERARYQAAEMLLPGINWREFAKLPKRVKSNNH